MVRDKNPTFLFDRKWHLRRVAEASQERGSKESLEENWLWQSWYLAEQLISHVWNKHLPVLTLFPSKTFSYDAVWIYLSIETTLDLCEPCTLGKPWQSGYPAHSFKLWETANSKSALSYLAYRKLKSDPLVASAESRHRQSKFSSCFIPHLPVSISPSGWLRLDTQLPQM